MILMAEVNRARLEEELVRHYTSQREPANPAMMNQLVSAMVAEDARMRRSQQRRMGEVAFVAAHVRFIPAWTWAAQAGLVALMCVLAHAANDASATKAAVGALSAMCVLVGMPTVQASKQYGVAELEYACAHNAASVMVVRLIVLGCSSALAVALMVGVTAPAVDASAFDVALWACPPFFVSCAGSLMALRRAHPTTAVLHCVAWTAACSIALFALAGTRPDLYAGTSLATWGAAAAAALAWLVHEVALTLRAAAAGLDAFSPQYARTNN